MRKILFQYLYKIKKIFHNQKGEGYVDVAVLVFSAMLVLAFIIKTIPAFIVKDQLNTLATQTLREAQMEGKININYNPIADALGIQPDNVIWEANTFSGDKVQLDEPITVTFIAKVNIGLFGEFGSFPISLKSKATGRSEVYWK